MWGWRRRKLAPSADEAKQRAHASKVLVYEAEARRVANLTLQYPHVETGGSLFGYWTHTGSPVVSFVSGPGVASRHAHASFYQDERYLYDLGTELYDRHALQHVGEWHSHHQLGLNEPSGGDIATVRSGMRQKGWPRFLLLIATIDNQQSGTVFENYYLFSSLEGPPEPLRIITLPGSSPLYDPKYLGREESSRPLENVEWRAGPFTPGTQASDAVTSTAWFKKDPGIAHVKQVITDLQEAKLEHRLLPVECRGEQGLGVALGSSLLILLPGFPEVAPVWVEDGRRRPVEGWSQSSNLVAWYLQARASSIEASN
jgi:hypothetical protein